MYNTCLLKNNRMHRLFVEWDRWLQVERCI